MTAVAEREDARIRFDRNELAGAFGDIGTDLPLLAGMILAAGLDPAGVLIMFGAMQWLTAWRYGMPMPVQPLKAMAVIVITQQIAAPVLYGGGIAIGLTMLLLVAAGALDWLARIVPKAVVRGLQLGLGAQLALLALRQYIPSAGRPGLLLAAGAFALTVILLGNRRLPPALLVVGLGVLYAFAFDMDAAGLAAGVGLTLPDLRVPPLHAIAAGFVLLALPQIPLSLGNSLLATRQLAADLFPRRRITIRRLGLTYATMNLIAPWFGGVPVCHGSGGLAGHYTFGARTGGSLLIYGALFVIGGLFFADVFDLLVRVFPLPVLGVLLLFEGLALAAQARDQLAHRRSLLVTVLVGVCAALLPYGYVIGMLAGTSIWQLHARADASRREARTDEEPSDS